MLVAIEALRYELFDVKFKSTKLQTNRTRTLLGQTILKNEGLEESDVNGKILTFLDYLEISLQPSVLLVKTKKYPAC